MRSSSSASGVFGWLASLRHERAQAEHRRLLTSAFTASIGAGDVASALEQVADTAAQARVNGWTQEQLQGVLLEGAVAGKGRPQVVSILTNPDMPSNLSQHGKRAVFEAVLQHANPDMYRYETYAITGVYPVRSGISLRSGTLLHRLARNYPQDATGAFEPLESILKYEIKTKGPQETLHRLQHYKAGVILTPGREAAQDYTGSIFHYMPLASRLRFQEFLKTQGVELELLSMPVTNNPAQGARPAAKPAY